MSKIGKLNPKKVFFFIGIAFLIIFFIGIGISHGEILKKYIFADERDTFMDFFNSLYDTVGRDPYGKGVIYPPLCYVVYLAFLRFIPLGELGNGPHYLKTVQGSMMSFMIYFMIILLLLIWLIIKLKKGNKIEKYTFLVLMLFSLPFMFAFERANIIVVSLIFLLIFMAYYNSENKILKEIALISLAVSAALKIYPAIFGLVLFKNKQFKEIIRVIIYGIICTILPFLLFGGIDTVSVFINNIFKTSDEFTTNIINRLNFTSFFDMFNRQFNLQNTIYPIIVKGIYILLFMVSCFSAYVTKHKWKMYALLTLLMIGIPSISFTYTGIFMIIPIYLFLDKESFNKFDYVYVALFCLLMFPNPICMIESGDYPYFYNHVSISSMIMSTSVLLLAIIINVDVIIEFIKSLKDKKNKVVKTLKKKQSKAKKAA